jgi:hypothetical protein
LFESGGQEGINALKTSKLAIEKYVAFKESSLERFVELDYYMESILYFCMNRTIGILLDINEFDDNIKGNLLKFQAEVENEIDASKLYEDSMSQNNRYGRHSLESKNILMQWHIEHSHQLYPTKDEVFLLSQKTGLTIEQVHHWLYNVRERKGNNLPNFGED